MIQNQTFRLTKIDKNKEKRHHYLKMVSFLLYNYKMCLKIDVLMHNTSNVGIIKKRKKGLFTNDYMYREKGCECMSKDEEKARQYFIPANYDNRGYIFGGLVSINALIEIGSIILVVWILTGMFLGSIQGKYLLFVRLFLIFVGLFATIAIKVKYGSSLKEFAISIWDFLNSTKLFRMKRADKKYGNEAESE